MTNDCILFDPRFGKRPARFAGRDDVLRDIRAALNDPEEQERVTILTGIKGSGKTSILAEIRSNPGSSGFTFIDLNYEKKSRTERPQAGENAIVYSVDDVSQDMPDIISFLEDFPKRVQKGENIRLILAGTPHGVDEILKDERVFYLQRVRRITLGNLRTDEVLALFTEAFAGTGTGQANESVLYRAAEATAGYPYLIQLIGYYLSKERGFDDIAADKAIFLAKIELYKNIHAPLVWSLSSKDRMFLWAMAQDEGHSEFGEITRRMDVSAGYASKYRERLINAGVIYSSSYGELAFTLPFMKEYVEKEYIERLGGEGGKRRL